MTCDPGVSLMNKVRFRDLGMGKESKSASFIGLGGVFRGI